jgi:hypothetical protein
MKLMRSTWTDSRLDDFAKRNDKRFGELSAQLTEQGGRIDRLQHVMTQGFIAIMVAMFTGFVGLAGLILTQV